MGEKMKRNAIDTMGGQAVIEGVMMRGKSHAVVSARRQDGKITSISYPLRKHSAFLRLAFIRGVVNLIDMLVIGTKALLWSAGQASDDGEEEQMGGLAVAGMLILSFGFALVVFVAIPYLLTGFLGLVEQSEPFWFNVTDGIIRIGFFLLYIIAIARMKDIRRVFEYHGAEHMAVHCYEKGKAMTVENVKTFPRLHPRCGTSFIMIVLLISILFFTIVPSAVMALVPLFSELSFWAQKGILFAARVIFIPLIAGVSYEILRFSAKHPKSRVFALLTKPGLWMQLITTRAPDAKQIKVAIHSLKEVLRIEGHKESADDVA
ncbi:TPA: DUF1385 domain-containing protein [Candidatus Woesearchaeota archaeon]|nr:DUF1385 domain-containing protein [Candidatus Woesearchaeota archaeon]